MDQDIYEGLDTESLGGDAIQLDGDGLPIEAAETPAGEEPAAEQHGDQPADPAADAGADQGPGDHAKAFAAYRAEIAELKQQVAQANYQQQQAAAAQQAAYVQAQQAQEAAQHQANLEELQDDPEQLALYLQHVQQAYQERAQQTQAMGMLRMSADLARAALPDFDAQLGKLYQTFGASYVDQMAASQPNPAMWAYQAAKMIQTPAEQAAALEAAVAARTAEIARAATPRDPVSSRSLGRIPAAGAVDTGNPVADKAAALNFGSLNPAFDSAYSDLLRAASH